MTTKKTTAEDPSEAVRAKFRTRAFASYFSQSSKANILNGPEIYWPVWAKYQQLLKFEQPVNPVQLIKYHLK